MQRTADLVDSGLGDSATFFWMVSLICRQLAKRTMANFHPKRAWNCCCYINRPPLSYFSLFACLPKLYILSTKTHSFWGRSMYILPLSWVTLSRQKIQTAVETDKFTKVHQRMAMFDSVCNWDGFYSESCLRFALEKHC